MTRTMRRCLLTLLQIFAPARRSWFGLCDMVKICRAGFKARIFVTGDACVASAFAAAHARGRGNAGRPKKRVAFFGSANSPLRIGYHVRRCPDCACSPGWPALGIRLFRHSRADDVIVEAAICVPPLLSICTGALICARSPLERSVFPRCCG